MTDNSVEYLFQSKYLTKQNTIKHITVVVPNIWEPYCIKEPCHGFIQESKTRNRHCNFTYIYVYKNKRRDRDKKRRYKVMKYPKKEIAFLIQQLHSGANRYVASCSLPSLYKKENILSLNRVYSEDIKHDSTPFNKTFIVNNCCRTCDKPECFNPFTNPYVRARISRCQLKIKKESCCCACNSDVIFEIMKSLYDCYKNKNCENCNCILCGCGHLPREEILEVEKSTVVTTSEHKIKEEKIKEKVRQEMGLRRPRHPEQSALKKEKIIRILAKQGIRLPEGKTVYERKMIDQVRKDMGLPAEAKTSSRKQKMVKALEACTCIRTLLKGKTETQKENILKAMVNARVPLPEGRTASEEALIEKVKAAVPSEFHLVPSKEVRKAKAKGLRTLLKEKSPEEKKRIIRGLIINSLPLPEAKTDSEKKLIDEVRKNLGLPLEPKTASMSAKLAKAYPAGVLKPLEGKTASQKLKALQKMVRAGQLPEGRTPSEKDLIDQVKAKLKAPSVFRVASEKIRKAMAAGLLTPLEGKTPKQKEKILRGLATNGIPLPEGKTPSEKVLIDKVRRDVGLPPKPQTSTARLRYGKAMVAGLITPLQGKSFSQKEKILIGLADLEIPLPEGRTLSEKALIADIKAASSAHALTIEAPPLEKIRRESKRDKQKEKLLKEFAKHGLPLPKGKTASEKKFIDQVRKDMGLPPEPRTNKERAKMEIAQAAGIITPLEGKSASQKEKILRKMANVGIELPEGRTSLEKSLINKIKAELKPVPAIPSEKLKAAKAAGLLTPLRGKTSSQKERILKDLAKQGLPLPEATSASEKKILHRVRKELGLPPEPKTASQKAKVNKAYATGIITPLEGKTPSQKEKILTAMADAGVPLPEGRTASEKAIISKVKLVTAPLKHIVPSEKVRKLRAEGLITPLEGKTPEEKGRIIKGLAQHGIPLPEGKTKSEKEIVDKVRKEMGLPAEAKTVSQKQRMAKALKAGIITPLEGKTQAQKEKFLKKLVDAGVPLPEGRTKSEKALIEKVKAASPPGLHLVPSEKVRKARAEGLITPLEGKSPKEKERIIKGLAKHGIPLPEGKTKSEKIMVKEVRKEMGLPVEAKTASQHLRMAKALAAGIITPLEGKTQTEKEKILKILVDAGLPLPEGRTESEKRIIEKVRQNVGLPPPRVAKGGRPPLSGDKGDKESAENIKEGTHADECICDLQPPLSKRLYVVKEPVFANLDKESAENIKEGTHADECICDLQTPLSKRLYVVKEPVLATISQTKLRAAKAAGLLTPLEGKTVSKKEKIIRGLAKQGIPLPEGKTASEKQIIDKVRKDMGLPAEATTVSQHQRMAKAFEAGIITPLEGKTKSQKEKILKSLADAGVPLPEGRTKSEKALIEKVKAATTPGLHLVPSEKLRKARAEGLLTPLEGKSPKEKERIIKGLAKHGIPLPEGKSKSEKKMVEKVRREMGLPAEAKTSSQHLRMAKALEAGIITPLERKTKSQKEKILKKLADAGVPLPEGRTKSEKALIEKVKAAAPPGLHLVPSEKVRKARAEGLITPLAGKAPEEKERIIKGLAKHGIPLPESKTKSEKKIVEKVRKEMGLPAEAKTASQQQRIAKALAAGIITPLEGKTKSQKQKILKTMVNAGISLPEGRTASEKALIEKVKAAVPTELYKVPSDKLRKARAEGLITPLEGKSPKEKERIIRGLFKHGIPLPEAKTASDRKIIGRVRKDMGLPAEAKTVSQHQRMAKALEAGIITPLEGKTQSQKKKILKEFADAGVPLPEGRTNSEKALIEKVKAATPPGLYLVPSEKIRKARIEGLITPLEGKSPKEKERIIRGLIKHGIPLPEAKTASDRKIIGRVRKDMGLSTEPKTTSQKQKMAKVLEAGTITPLEGKTKSQKEKTLKAMVNAGIPLPEGRTASEKALIEKVKAATPPGLYLVPSEKVRKARAEGLITPLKGKSPKEKERIIRGLVKHGIPLPEAKTTSERKIIDQVRKDMGLPAEAKTTSQKQKMAKALEAGIITPLEGKTASQKRKIMKAMVNAGIPLPEGKTASEKALIEKVKAAVPTELYKVPSEKLHKARAEGLITPLEGKSPKEKERIIRGLIKHGLPLPEAKTESKKKLIDKARADAGISLTDGKTVSEKSRKEKIPVMVLADVPLPEGRTASEKSLIAKVKAVTSEKLRKAKAEGLLTPLEGKTPKQKETILRGLAKHGLLPEGRTKSDKKLIAKVRKEMGLPPKPKTASQKRKIAAAHVAGIISPLEGKSASQKEKILKALADAGVTLPEGRSKSEKALIAKVKAAAGTKKTTTCEAACGCNKKKIKFKEKYVEIKVTSPDISSLCDCPPKCIPRVESRVFVDEEGIKVIIGRATGVCLYTPKVSKYIIQPKLKSRISYFSLPSIALNSSNLYGNTKVNNIPRNRHTEWPRNQYVENNYIDNCSFKAFEYNSQSSIDFYDTKWRQSNFSTIVCGECRESVKSTTKSYESIREVESSLSLSTSPFSEPGTVSVISFAGSTISSNERQCSRNTFGGNIENNPSDEYLQSIIHEKGRNLLIANRRPQHDAVCRVPKNTFMSSRDTINVYDTAISLDRPVTILDDKSQDVIEIVRAVFQRNAGCSGSSVYLLVTSDDSDTSSERNSSTDNIPSSISSSCHHFSSHTSTAA